jgi:hypothetical protein
MRLHRLDRDCSVAALHQHEQDLGDLVDHVNARLRNDRDVDLHKTKVLEQARCGISLEVVPDPVSELLKTAVTIASIALASACENEITGAGVGGRTLSHPTRLPSATR